MGQAPEPNCVKNIQQSATTSHMARLDLHHPASLLRKRCYTPAYLHILYSSLFGSRSTQHEGRYREKETDAKIWWPSRLYAAAIL